MRKHSSKAKSQLGYAFAECHHTVPVSELGAGQRTRLAELAVVCANCHRMIHRSRPMLTVGGLRAVVEGRRGR
jgi:5-methylcytosine-specific restriction protein A